MVLSFVRDSRVRASYGSCVGLGWDNMARKKTGERPECQKISDSLQGVIDAARGLSEAQVTPMTRYLILVLLGTALRLLAGELGGADLLAERVRDSFGGVF